jgi:hypothetical protein
MMRDSQNSNGPNKEPAATVYDDVPKENDKPAPKSYYYDDATGYEIYQEQDEAEDETNGDRDKQTEE